MDVGLKKIFNFCDILMDGQMVRPGLQWQVVLRLDHIASRRREQGLMGVSVPGRNAVMGPWCVGLSEVAPGSTV